MDTPSTPRELNYIVCVDDEQIILNQISTQLEEEFAHQCTIEYAESAEEALELMEEITEEGGLIRLVISDQVMPGMPGDRFLEIVHQQYPQTSGGRQPDADYLHRTEFPRFYQFSIFLKMMDETGRH